KMSIKVKGLKEVQDKLHKLSHLGGDIEPFLADTGEILRNEIEDSFEKQSSPFGKQWKALKESTKKYKDKKGYSSNVLRKSGDLADKWEIKTTNTSVRVFNALKSKGYVYGLVHQFGTNKAGRGKNTTIPARPFLPISKKGFLKKELKDEIKKDCINYIKDILA
ncbi:phage virion morphogenesis protein, partial [Campylobacter blaseri]